MSLNEIISLTLESLILLYVLFTVWFQILNGKSWVQESADLALLALISFGLSVVIACIGLVNMPSGPASWSWSETWRMPALIFFGGELVLSIVFGASIKRLNTGSFRLKDMPVEKNLLRALFITGTVILALTARISSHRVDWLHERMSATELQRTLSHYPKEARTLYARPAYYLWFNLGTGKPVEMNARKALLTCLRDRLQEKPTLFNLDLSVCKHRTIVLNPAELSVLKAIPKPAPKPVAKKA